MTTETKVRGPIAGIEPLMSLDEIAGLLGVSRRTVEGLKSRGSLPPPDLRVGRCLRWRAATVRGWLDGARGSV